MPSATRYSMITKMFHWLTALLIFVIIPLGVVANQLPYDTSEQLARKATVFSLHKTLGVTVFFVALLRILWALPQTKPGPLHPERKIETFLAEVVHWVLYISLVAVPLTGWIEHAASSGFAPIWWPYGQNLPLIPKSESLAGVFAGLHWIFGKLMVASILLHIAGALKHHIIDKDVTLVRMWFKSGSVPDVGPHVAKKGAPITAALAFVAAAGGAVALGLTQRHDDAVAVADLAEVTSDWTVQDGSIAITITQFGSEVTGTFADWTSQISFDPATADIMGSVETVIAIGSLSLGSVTSEALGVDYFDAQTHPTATFSAEIQPDGTQFIADGTLTIKDVTVPVQMPFTLTLEGETAQMSGGLTLDRLDFGMGETQNDESTLAFAVDVAVTVLATRASETSE